jgi:hypothetical protein
MMAICFGHAEVMEESRLENNDFRGRKLRLSVGHAFEKYPAV